MSVARITDLARKFGVLEISNVVLEDKRFSVWPGSHKKELHHHQTGGLAQHTWEVIELSLRNNDFFHLLDKAVDTQKLFLAALFHDSGKMWDYKPATTIQNTMFPGSAPTLWEATTHKRQIYHLARSALVWNAAKEKFNYKDDADEILHAILAHHGRREYGSPVSPATRLAWILHLSDSLSARCDDFGTLPLHQEIK